MTSTITNEPQYLHSPLPDPTTHFRLLLLTPISPDFPLTLAGSLHPFPFSSPPAYEAISYCWDDPTLPPAVLTLDSRPFPVHANCHTSLAQVAAQTSASPSGRWLWIDSVCINQRDLTEKAAQVARMANIYQNAERVLACLGPEGGDSGFLLRVLRGLRPGETEERAEERTTIHTGSLGEEIQRRTVKGLVGLGTEFPRFAHALRAFSRRAFFGRMWIYQEMFLASEVRMLCGTDEASMSVLKDVERVCALLVLSLRPQQEYDYKEDQFRLLDMLTENELFWAENRYTDPSLGHPSGLGNLPIFVQQLHRGKRALRKLRFAAAGEGIVDVLRNNRPLQCRDPRDKIFGVMSLFEACNIMPDYGCSCFELALRVLREYRLFEGATKAVELADMLCANLQLRSDLPEVENSMVKFQTRDEPTRQATLAGSNDQDSLHETTPWACQIQSDQSGRLTAPFRSPYTHANRDVEGKIGPAQDVDASRDSYLKTIVVHGRPAALVPSEAVAGDWIVPLAHYITSYYSRYRIGLVLRETSNGRYAIVGETAFYPLCQPCISWENCACQFGPDFHDDHATSFSMSFGCEELLLLSIRLHEPFGRMRRDSPTDNGSEPGLPGGPWPIWARTKATRRVRTEPLISPSRPRVRGNGNASG